MKPRDRLYKTAGVDTAATQSGLHKIIERIKQTWPAPGGVGAVKLDIGYFANVIDIGGIGLAICTDGVGSKSIVAQMMHRYDTIGIDCVAMNVNDVICVGARPISMVDYIAVEKADAEMLGAIAIGLRRAPEQAGISISGGEISPLKDVIRGFDLVGMAVGMCRSTGSLPAAISCRATSLSGSRAAASTATALTLARHVFFEAGQIVDRPCLPRALASPWGEELLRPTLIYVPEILEIIDERARVKALINITGDGLLNLPRVEATVGFMIDDLPPAPPIFRLDPEHVAASAARKCIRVYNMGIGFCVLVAEKDRDATLSILQRHGRRAQVIGRVIEDDSKGVYLPRQRLVGHGKQFREQ